MGVVEKIKEIEAEMNRTQKNKATEYHLGLLKAKLAKLRSQLLEPTSKAVAGDGFDVKKFGDSRVALIGFPSVGKSTLLSTLTNTHSEQAAYEFTTLTCIPGVINYNNTEVQLLDLPGIIEGAAQGSGRGRQVIAVARSSDLVFIVLDASKEYASKCNGTLSHKKILKTELEAVGLRLNKSPPDIYFKKKASGGVSFNSTLPLTQLGDDPQRFVMSILHEYKIHNAEVLFREDCNIDELIDVIEGNRRYVKCLYIYNKIDTITIEEVDRLARKYNSVVISCNLNMNLDYLLERMWEELALVRVYTKRKGLQPDFSDPIVLTSGRNGVTIDSACAQIHKDMARDFKFALVWGSSSKFSPQRCGLQHKLNDEDVIQIAKKSAEEQRHDKNYSERVQNYYDNYHLSKKKKAPLKL
eukprot:TRINITY_DN1982_c0_g1_i1.p1 TRINITY_DN1982_c0_g1~~TRINITY_DN1982_c0_g1_i1.p1  ORF type:complete len:412 (-),score=189.27 TRINITY_DN1982_c0_g1_i1:139-1374(-)